MDMDPDIANWVLEVLLRQPLEDRTLNSLLRALPLPNDKPNLGKSLLLKKLESDASRNSISERTLELLEQLEEIEFQRGNETVSDAMKRAYCSVAVVCTVKSLTTGDGGGDSSKYEFFELAKRVWRERIGRMLNVVDRGGLCSEELRLWKDEIETAVWEDSVRESVVRKSEGVNAVEAVNSYLKEEWEKMGPSFLELVATKAKDDSFLELLSSKDKDDEVIIQGSVGVGNVDGVAVKEVSPCRAERTMDVNNDSNEKQKGKIHLRNKLVGLRRPKRKGLACGNSRGAKIVEDSDGTETSYRNYNLLCSAEVKKVREALASSSAELQAVVKDPLPDALQHAAAISDVARKNKNENDPVKENPVQPSLFVVDRAGVVQDSNVPKPSLMERNGSAHTFEWDESIDGSEEARTCRRLIPLPSPRLINVSPLKKYENINLRRKKRKWSLLEEDTLRTGVQEYGKGNWKVILNAHRDIFVGRTEVDLKDKWRNLTR